MYLDRGVLARIDRRLLSGLSQAATFHMVRVPATEAKWATWKRYRDAAGLSMGRAIAALIDRELVSVFGEVRGDEVPVFAAEAKEELTRREAAVADREGRLGGEEQRLWAWRERLRLREDELQIREQQAEFVAKLAANPRATSSKIGRNERCPCGSGVKYKHCHGLPGGPGWYPPAGYRAECSASFSVGVRALCAVSWTPAEAEGVLTPLRVHMCPLFVVALAQLEP